MIRHFISTMLSMAGIICFLQPSLSLSDTHTQRNHFTSPVTVTYGDPAVIAPLQTAVLTADWDHDGWNDIVEYNRWWRNTGRKHNGLDLFEYGGNEGVPRTMTFFIPEMIGDLDGDQYEDLILTSLKTNDLSHQEYIYVWWENESTNGISNFVKKGPLKFALDRNPTPPETIGYPMHPWLADWDGDGRTDLLIGTSVIGLGTRYLPQPEQTSDAKTDFTTRWIDNTWADGVLTGTVWWHRNVGTKENPLFTGGRLIQAGDTGRALTFWAWAKPAACDWNNDGKRDLLVTTFDRLVVFLNVGTAHTWDQADPVPKLDDGHLITFNGDSELFYQYSTFIPFRDEQGQRHLRCSVGGPTLEARQLDQNNPFAFEALRPVTFINPPIDVFNFPIPDAADWDGDGKIDLLVGCDAGWIWFIKNLHPTGDFGRWDLPKKLVADGNPIRLWKFQGLQGPAESMWGYTNPTAADWDLDGDIDLICGSTDETYTWYENIGTVENPELMSRGPLLTNNKKNEPIKVAWRTKPGVGDLNNDDLPDLVGMNPDRNLCWWPRYRDENGQLALADQKEITDSDGNTFSLSKGYRSTGRAKMVVCDWNHDNKPDIICSPPKFEGIRYLRYFKNLGVKNNNLTVEYLPEQILLDPPPVDFYLEEFGCGQWGHYYMAIPVDFDRNGQWEVISAVDIHGLFYWKQ